MSSSSSFSAAKTTTIITSVVFKQGKSTIASHRFNPPLRLPQSPVAKKRGYQEISDPQDDEGSKPTKIPRIKIEETSPPPLSSIPLTDEPKVPRLKLILKTPKQEELERPVKLKLTLKSPKPILRLILKPKRPILRLHLKPPTTPCNMPKWYIKGQKGRNPVLQEEARSFHLAAADVTPCPAQAVPAHGEPPYGLRSNVLALSEENRGDGEELEVRREIIEGRRQAERSDSLGVQLLRERLGKSSMLGEASWVRCMAD